MWVALAVGAVLLVRYLRGVLLPFLVAWIVAYLLYPLVIFLERRCHLRFRIVSIVVSLALVLAVVGGVVALVVPPTLASLAEVGALVSQLAEEYLGSSELSVKITQAVQRYVEHGELAELMQRESVQQALWAGLRWLWDVVCQTAGFVVGLLQSCIVVLYLFFILIDYERIQNGCLSLVPESHRQFALGLVHDVQRGMSSYFRAQSLIALLVGVLFAAGFAIVGLPMGVGLGLFIGVLNLVPYLQLVGILPTMLCALLRSAETGESFWVVMLWCLVVFAVVQTIQDTLLTPAIMGRRMGLRPAVILLSLSVWGSLLGVAGLIVALPLTTLLLSYYKRYVLHRQD